MAEAAKRQKSWNITPSVTTQRTNNPIRKIVDGIKFPPEDPEKPVIKLSLGDPTVFGNLKTPKCFVDKIVENLQSYTANSYIHSAGTAAARAAIAKRESRPNAPLTADDVVIASGCSGALELAITVLMNEGQNILVPSPGFPLYETIANSKGGSAKYYNCLPEKSWEVDVEHLESLIDASTAAIVVTNPSNPCGSVYSKEHLLAILAVASKHHVPIIADEIYGNMTFSGVKFHSMAELSDDVPVLSSGGIAKEFLVPGWRVGWVLVHDKHGVFAEIRKGLMSLSQLILGANSLIQSALPAVLDPEPGSAAEAELAEFRASTMAVLEGNAKFTVDRLGPMQGLRVVVPQGAMYVMVGIDPAMFADIEDDVQFTQKLLDEESVFVLPGQCFGMRNFFRVVFSAPQDVLASAYARIETFIARHKK